MLHQHQHQHELDSWSALRILETKAERLRRQLAASPADGSNFDLRERNRAQQELQETVARIDRQLRCRNLFDQLGDRPVARREPPPRHLFKHKQQQQQQQQQKQQPAHVAGSSSSLFANVAPLPVFTPVVAQGCSTATTTTTTTTTGANGQQLRLSLRSLSKFLGGQQQEDVYVTSNMPAPGPDNNNNNSSNNNGGLSLFSNGFNDHQELAAAAEREKAEKEKEKEKEKEEEQQQKRSANSNSIRFLRDLTLPRPPLVDKRSVVFVDTCRCGAMMQRHATMSYLVCPVCSCKRVEIDMCAKDTTMTVADHVREAHHVKHAPKTASHYGTFLNTNRNKRARVPVERLRDLCFFAYVEGARSPEDITHRLLNRAQKHTGYVEYPATRSYVALLRNDNVRIPNEIKVQMVKLYQYMQPVYSRCKHEVDDSKTNMPKFTFLSRIFCRFLGVDVLVPLFDNFKMSNIVVRRTAFMRRVFRRLGWEWSDSISDVSEAELDRFEAENGFDDDDDDSDDDDDNDNDDNGCDDMDSRNK